ncbi:uncharacterized protein L969DRAFT_89782 [Mixia osmundae IAM 14324]|uniref:uncharacterized protein n=1 Tax=Mixia osmundae (strain CBS 9802 / IAM 14324 / JCM 22182 / KY 12970) TaxID=764103 RepID=UPI0004A55794|nr:uncharacterized protein L969DRAFT_91241 [Mixia osmundae IAM 14324]XP_014565824.1 uncharacterized protein L969DRAFT_89782 [Mixia osmundae IAM 14324]KEI36123.1 hypothetical protein L969DRAFT_91241 [Mixia osmundae IAM 14324]KEI37236.1 hypothetical protein L969DRAFT_89782 [Mixia osmundae IAM 14324]
MSLRRQSKRLLTIYSRDQSGQTFRRDVFVLHCRLEIIRCRSGSLGAGTACTARTTAMLCERMRTAPKVLPAQSRYPRRRSERSTSAFLLRANPQLCSIPMRTAIIQYGTLHEYGLTLQLLTQANADVR